MYTTQQMCGKINRKKKKPEMVRYSVFGSNTTTTMTVVTILTEYWVPSNWTYSIANIDKRIGHKFLKLRTPSPSINVRKICIQPFYNDSIFKNVSIQNTYKIVKYLYILCKIHVAQISMFKVNPWLWPSRITSVMLF
jgi:hypothetical protein